MINIPVKIKKLNPDAIIPKKATPGSAAYDVYVYCDTILRPGRQVIPLGLAIEMPDGYEAKVEPRSGYSSKGFEAYEADTARRIDADVIEGKIDSDFRDGIGVIVHSREGKNYTIRKGQRIAQLTFYKVETADFKLTDTLTETQRKGGFGYTGA